MPLIQEIFDKLIVIIHNSLISKKIPKNYLLNMLNITFSENFYIKVN